MTDLQSRLQTALGTQYRIERELGGGGMSHVFLAEDVELARKVVVKVLPPDMAAGINAERFRREIQLAASLQHPHIVPLIAAGRAGDLAWYTMPFIEGESLRAKLARERELPVSDVVRILRDVTDALSYAHEHGVVHRDIKPDNVLLTGRHAVVTDFGVAKALSASTGESSLTSVGVALGTPAYMAPEQAAADPYVDHRADIYSTGAMAYEMLTGHPPFAGTPQMVLAAHVTKAPEPVTQRRASIPPALATLIMRSLEKKAADRWQSASELHEQFELMATPSGGAQPTSAVFATAARPAGKRPLVIAAGVAVLALATVAVLKYKPAVSVATGALDPHVVAVMPFRVAGADPALHYLRQGMLDLLQAKLTGEGGPRASDARSVLAAFRDAGGTDDIDVPESALQSIAQKLGAGRVLQGSIVGPANHFVLSASLLEMPGGRSLAQASVEGPKDSLFALVDRLVVQILALGAGASAQQLGSLTTTNQDALRAYLDGIVAYRRANYQSATQNFTRAVQLDSTFSLALSALVEADGWYTGSIDSSRVDALAWKYRDRLSTRDQLILSVRLGSRYPDPTPWTERIADREQIAQQMPESPYAWFVLGDALFHFGALSDIPDAMPRAKAAFLRAFQLDSLNGQPLSHMPSISVIEGDVMALKLWSSRLSALDSTSTLMTLNWRLLIGSMERDAPRVTTLLDSIGAAPGAANDLIRFFPYDSVAISNREVLGASMRREATSLQERAWALMLTVHQLWNAGRPRDARAWIDSLAATGIAPVQVVQLRTIDAALFGGDTTGVTLAAQRLPNTPGGIYAREVLNLRRGSASTVDQADVSLKSATNKSASGLGLRLASILEAWASVLRSAPRATSERLLAVADSAVRGWSDWPNSPTEYGLFLGPLNEELGLFDRALTATRRRNYPLGFPEIIGLAESLRVEGRIAAKAGDRAGAILAYERFLLMRLDAEPSKHAQRDSVAAELAALRRTR